MLRLNRRVYLRILDLEEDLFLALLVDLLLKPIKRFANFDCSHFRSAFLDSGRF